MDEEQLIIWQDVLDEIVAGRKDDLPCPHCSHRPMQVDDMPGGKTRISCSKCKQFIEGSFGAI